MYQNILCLTEAMPHAWTIIRSVRDNGTRGGERGCNLADHTSLRAQVSKTTGVFRCWIRTRLWRRHRPRSEQAGILRYAKGGIRAFA